MFLAQGSVQVDPVSRRPPHTTLGNDERGLTSVEYLVAALLIAVAGIVGWKAFGATSSTKVDAATRTLDGTGAEGGPGSSEAATRGAHVYADGQRYEVDQFHPRTEGPHLNPYLQAFGGYVYGVGRFAVNAGLGLVTLASALDPVTSHGARARQSLVDGIRGAPGAVRDWWHTMGERADNMDYFGVGDSVGMAVGTAAPVVKAGVGLAQAANRAGAVAAAEAEPFANITPQALDLADLAETGFGGYGAPRAAAEAATEAAVQAAAETAAATQAGLQRLVNNRSFGYGEDVDRLRGMNPSDTVVVQYRTMPNRGGTVTAWTREMTVEQLSQIPPESVPPWREVPYGTNWRLYVDKDPGGFPLKPDAPRGVPWGSTQESLYRVGGMSQEVRAPLLKLPADTLVTADVHFVNSGAIRTYSTSVGGLEHLWKETLGESEFAQITQVHVVPPHP